MGDNGSVIKCDRVYTHGIVYDETIGCQEAKSVWYFAYGAMMNPTSLKLRSLMPRESHMACLPDYQLHFRHPGGWADVAPCEGKEVYGVMHLISQDEQKILDAIEGIYERKPLVVEMEDGRKVCGGVYIMSPRLVGVSELKDDLPQQRYLDILIEGAQYFCLPSAYITWLASHASTPRVKPDDFRSFPAPSPSSPVFTQQELAKMGEESKQLVCAVNGKVMRCIVEEDSFLITWALKHFQGKEAIYFMSASLYEPLYTPFPSCYAEMCEEHKQRAEDTFVRTLPKPVTEMFEVLGRLDSNSQNPCTANIQEPATAEAATDLEAEEKEAKQSAAHKQCENEQKEAIAAIASSPSLEGI